MAKVFIKQKGIEDLNNIWENTCEKWSESQADQYYFRLKLACKENGKDPKIGKEYNAITKNLRGLHSGRHITFYQPIDKGQIEAIRILHDRMDLKSRLNE